MSDNQRALAMGKKFTFAGDEYEIQPLTLKHYFQFEAWIERQAFLALERAKAICPKHVYDDLKEQVIRDATTQQYGYGGELYASATRTLAGKKYLALLSLQEKHPSIDDETVNAMFEDGNVAAEVCQILVDLNQ